MVTVYEIENVKHSYGILKKIDAGGIQEHVGHFQK